MGVGVVATLQAKKYSKRPEFRAHKIEVETFDHGLVSFKWDGTGLLFEIDDLIDLTRILQISRGKLKEVKEVTNYNVWTQ